MLNQGSTVSATTISIFRPTKNEKGEPDPEVHQTTESDQWHFRIKIHIGVDDTLGLDLQHRYYRS